MKTHFLFALVVTFSFKALAQQDEKLPLVNSKLKIEEGVLLHDEKSYEEAIKRFLQVPESDTNYVYMLSELALTYNANEDYTKAIEIASANKDSNNEFRVHFMNILGSAYDDSGDPETAIAIYKEGLAVFPYDIQLHYNLALTLFQQKKYQEFYKIAQRGVKLNPFHIGLNILLGSYMEIEGSKAKAAMSYALALALEPANNAILVRINNLFKDAIKDFKSKPDKYPDFYDLELLINSNIANDTKFKTDIELRAPVAQQLELIFESLKYQEESEDFYMQFYVPLYAALQSNEHENAFIHHILKSSDNKDVLRWLNRNEKELNSFFSFTNNFLDEIRSNQYINVDDTVGDYTFWFNDNNVVSDIGTVENDHNTGYWRFYHSNGELSARGLFDQSGRKQGEWLYYFNDGKFSKSEYYNDGLVEKNVDFYNARGYKNTYVEYVNDKASGKVILYYPHGSKKEQWIMEEGVNNGPGCFFSVLGDTLYTYNFEKGKLSGDYYSYFPNGQINESYT